MFTSAGKSISGAGGGAGNGVGSGGVNIRRDGNPILNSFGQVLVSDSSYAHHSMSMKALKEAKFSPGLGQAPSHRRLQPSTSFSPRHANVQAFLKRERYAGENHAGDHDDDDDDEFEAARRTSRRADQMPTQQQTQPQVKRFDPKTAIVAPKVPLASEAVHKPSGGNVKIFSEKLSWNVESKIPKADKSKPKQSDVVIWHDPASGPKKYDHVGAKVPSASAAASYKPSGGNVTVQHRKLEWNAEPKVPQASEASKYQPRVSEKVIFSEKLDFGSNASPTVPTAADAASYKRRGGQENVFEWQRSPDTRRPAPIKKTEDQILEEFFPGSGTSGGGGDMKGQEEKSSLPQIGGGSSLSGQSYTSRRRRDLLLRTD